MDPLLPLGPLTTDIEQLICQFAHFERRLRNTSRLHTRSQDILVRRHVPGGRHPIDRSEVVHSRVVQLELARAAHGLFHASVLPEPTYRVRNVPREHVALKLRR